ncbi:DoxX family protein [Actinoplanes sp. NBC_00393]|uniref:DoxX family protein n=1 Tax=Actinoplanes sp. NBC_00393 TaxID=2975953 RepID=UPI002E208921
MHRHLRFVRRTIEKLEDETIAFAARHGLRMLRVSLGIVFVWFAVPKFKPGLSAVDTLAQDTIAALTAHLLTGHPATFLLALLELAIGIGLVTGLFLRLTLAGLMFQMAGTLTPLALFPEQTWKAPLVLSLEGQFIVKNLVLIAAGIAVAGSLGRAGLTSRHPAIPATARHARAGRPAALHLRHESEQTDPGRPAGRQSDASTST